MLRTFALVVVVSLAPALVVAQDWAVEKLEASPRHQEWVEVKHGDRTVEAFVVYPEVAEKATAVVVIHEIFGLSDWVRGTADDLAAAGYIAIAPDLLSGAGPDGGGTASLGGRDGVVRAIRGLDPDQITADLNATAKYVTELPAANDKVAVCGFCWGGSQTFRYATNNPDLAAAFVFYGSGPDDSEAIEQIACPVYGFYGEMDNRVNSTIDRSRELTAGADKRYEPVIYDGAGHGFMRAGEQPDASEENAQARQDAWERWRDILAEL